MNNTILLALMFFLLLSINVHANEKPIVEQGNISVTFSDIDGYAQKIPKKDRANFFYSVQRIDKTVYNILNMKHIVKYGNNKNIIDDAEIEKLVTERILKENIKQDQVSNVLNNNDYLLYKDFITLEESYKFMLRYVKQSVKKEDLYILAEEQYMVNKESYYQPESRDISYFSILYNNDNKEKIRARTFDLIKELEDSNDFNLFKEKYNEEKEISITLNLDNYKYNKEFKSFSDYVFGPKKSGVIKQPLDAKNRFIVVLINKITKKFYIPFNDVKEDLVKGLVKDKTERDFRELLLKLTQEPVEINQQALVDLKTRYIN